MAAGALAKAGDVGGSAVIDTYNALRNLIVSKLGTGDAVQKVENDPHSEAALATLASALARAGLAADPELAKHAEILRSAIPVVEDGGAGEDIEVGNIFAKRNVLVDNLIAKGRIKLGDLTGETGDVTLTNLSSGAAAKKKV